MSIEENLKLMKTLDDSWNSQDWDTFSKRHAETAEIYWPVKPQPTRGKKDHKDESMEFFTAFPNNHIDNDPYKILFGQDDWTCSVANFTGTFKGPMKGFDGKTIEPTNKKFQLEFCTVAHWKNGEIVEEKLFL